jgi:tetratricopeptide (TPR) repeat protein
MLTPCLAGSDRPTHRLTFDLPAIVITSPVQSPVDSQDAEQAFLDALRERRLYRLMEVYCQKQFARGDATPAERARYTIELANILAAHAQQQTQATARTDLWKRASELLRGFLAQNPQHSQAVALEFQLGVYELLQGEVLRQQSKLVPQDRELADAARTRLRSALDTFRRVEAEVTQAMKKRTPAEAAAGDQPTQKQLVAIATTTRFRLGQAALLLAQTYPRNSADQTELAAQAKTQFEAFTQRYSTNELTLESYLGRAECLRLLGDPTESLKTLRELQRNSPPEKFYDRSLVIQAQLTLEQKKTGAASARNFIEETRKMLRAPNPELDLLYVQSLLELAREQSRGQGTLAARQLVASATEEMDRIKNEHGAYWSSRCDLLLAELAAENVLVDDPAVLMRLADGLAARGDHDGTVKTLDRAAKLARERGDANQTVELAFRAATVRMQASDVEDAAERFATIASTYPNHPKAPLAQFRVAHCLATAYAADKTAERLATYDRALEQHLRMFGGDPTAAEVRWLLGSLRFSQRRWQDAIEHWRGIPQSHARFAEARQELSRTYAAWLAELWARSQPAERVAGDAITYLNQALAGSRGAGLTKDDVALALRLAQILVHPTVARYDDAEQVLEQILFGQSASDAERAEARRLSVTALLGQDKFDEARRAIETEFVGIPQELFAVVQALEESAGRSSDARRRLMGKLQLAATERLVKEAEHLTPEQSTQAEIYLALAYVNAGEANRADQIFVKLRDRIPNNPRVLEAQAECFMQLGRHAQARELWRQLAGMLRENSPAWFNAKLKLATACFLAGDVPQCLKIILVTEQLHPDLGGPELKAKFEELKAKCVAK